MISPALENFIAMAAERSRKAPEPADCVLALAPLMLELIEGMRAGDVSQADLDFARTARVEAFPATLTW